VPPAMNTLPCWLSGTALQRRECFREMIGERVHGAFASAARHWRLTGADPRERRERSRLHASAVHAPSARTPGHAQVVMEVVMHTELVPTLTLRSKLYRLGVSTASRMLRKTQRFEGLLRII
jgi:hypothetical protein